ncbi:MAG: transcriptional regulator [Bacteroidetes bacterium HGW-Bacteroidetes-2]|jgi:CRP-like cAMP-binding protein|nr:MAG: transcriptional regulator [Bacteroidetes bacterium HGW-Bacteroidetes-2]
MKNILLIEDDTALRENTKELLEIANYNVITAPNGKMGATMALKFKVDLILCDILIPELNGYEVYAILSKNKKTRDIPFIFISAKINSKDIRFGMNMGVDDYIPKPFDEIDLIKAIESRLAKFKILKENVSSNRIKEEVAIIHNLQALKEYIKRNGEVLEVDKNDIIYEAHKIANYVYFISHGIVKCYTIDDAGKELITEIHKKTHFFGFETFKNEATHIETSTAIEHTVAYRISKTKFHQLLEENNELAIEFAELLSDKLATLKFQLLQTAYASVLRKTTNTILQFVEKMENNSKDFIIISRKDLASVAGISTESFIRSLYTLKEEALIELKGRYIKILDLQKLKNIR